MAQAKPGHEHTRTASSIIFTPSPGHSWTVHSHPSTPPYSNPASASSPNLNDTPAASTPYQAAPQYQPYGNSAPSSSHHARSLRAGGSGRPSVEIQPPELTARAPNSRSGLTDEAIPGQPSFLPPIKRQSTRLSKHKSPGHARTKSRRSSRGSMASQSGPVASAPPAMGRFSFDQVDGGRKTSISERNGTGLGMNPFTGEGGPGGLWPPPRKPSFPELNPGMVGIAS
jgi:hypothetical protein